MNQIVNFNEAANVALRRSKFKIPSRELTTFNAGDLVPIYMAEVLPGDTFKMNTSMLVRATTSLHPTMDNAYIDVFYFFVPTRLVWDNWQHFNGESDTAWAQDDTYVIPQLKHTYAASTTSTGVEVNSILDHFGVFPNIQGDSTSTSSSSTISFNALPIRSYFKIWNDWFRDENLQDSYDIYTGDNDEDFAAYLSSSANVNLGDDDSLLKVSKYHDYFTSALPKPQKGNDVLIPASGFGQVNLVPLTNSIFGGSSGKVQPTFGTAPMAKSYNSSGTLVETEYDPINRPNSSDYDGFNEYVKATGSGSIVQSSGIIASSGSTTTSNLVYNPGSSLIANLNSVEITVNNLRLAVQTQKLLEKDARGGTRYTEILRSHFGVTSPDSRLQRSEYLGGKHVPINMAEIAQTSASDESNDQWLGDLAGYSATADSGHDFTKSFVEHGYVIGLACVRTCRTYSQGIEKIWFKKNRLDFYWPVLANIGEQPIYKKELYFSANASNSNDNVFGYQEAWAEYRYKPNKLSGYFRAGVTGSLVSWTYGESYDSAPTLSKEWIIQDKDVVDQTLTVTSSETAQFIADFAFDCIAFRPLPIYSIPGYMDHF